MSKPLVAIVVSSLMFGACAKKGPDSATAANVPPPPPVTTTTVVAEPPPPEQVAAPTPPPVEEPPPPAPLTDAQIAKVLDAVDTGEIAQAKLAQKKSKNAKVKQFAAHMIQAHNKSKTKAGAWAKKIKLTPEESPVSQELTAKSAEKLATLEAADAASFDSAYIAAQAQQHEEVLGLLDSRLAPAATDEALKGFLTETRTMVEQHVTKAKEVEAALAAAPAPAAAKPAAEKKVAPAAAPAASPAAPAAAPAAPIGTTP